MKNALLRLVCVIPMPRADAMETSTAVKAASTTVPTTLGKGRLRQPGEHDALVWVVDIPTEATMAVATTADSAPTAGVVATAGMAATAMDGVADIGAIQATVGAGVSDLALGGRGVGDTRIATSTALRITLPTPTTIRRIALQATGALPTRTTTLRYRIPPRDPEAAPQALGDPRQELRATKLALSPPFGRGLRFCRLTREKQRRTATGSRTPLPCGI